MSEENKLEVEVRADQGTESLGKNAYFAAKEGRFDSKGFRSSVTVMLGLMALIFMAMALTKNSGTPRNSNDKGLPAPVMSREDNGINPKLLTSKDLTNIIARPKTESSYYGKIKIVSLRSLSQVPVGAEALAILESGATDGIVKARLTSPLLVDGEPVLPERSILFGRGKSGEERLFVEFSKVIFPSGETYAIRAQAFDSADKIQGLKGALVGTRSKKMAGAMAFGFLGGMADGLQDTSGSNFMGHKPSVRDAALAGASKAALDQSQAYLEEMKKSPNVIEVKTGTAFVIIMDEPKSKEDRYEQK